MISGCGICVRKTPKEGFHDRHMIDYAKAPSWPSKRRADFWTGTSLRPSMQSFARQ